MATLRSAFLAGVATFILCLYWGSVSAGCPGCCSSHGGITQSCSSGKVVCADGTVSPSCTCSSCGVAAVTWAPIQGNVRTTDGIPVCALVLANGQYMFSCGGNGTYSLDVPLDEQGLVTLFAFADGFAPYRVTAAPGGLPAVVRTVEADPDSPQIYMGWDMACAANSWIRISGEIESFEGDPLCALVLANGQHMFSCGASQGRYDLTVPADENGNITLFGFADGFQPYSEIFGAPACAR